MRTKTHELLAASKKFMACEFCYTSNNKGVVHSRRLGVSPFATPLATPLATLDPFLDCLLAIPLASFITLPLFAHCISFCLLHLVQLPLLVLLNLGFFHLFQTVWAYIHSENGRKASKSRGIPASEKDSFELCVLRLFLKPPASHLTGTPEFYFTLQTQSSRTEMVLFLGYCIYSHNRITCLFIPNSIELINQCLNMAFMWFHNHCTFLFKQWLLAFLQELRLAGKW
jgi:hypothetical protein